MLHRLITAFSLLFPLPLLLLSLAGAHHSAYAETPPAPLRIGFVGALSSFASNYGTAVLRGAQLAVAELKDTGNDIDLVIEDDQSDSKRTVVAFNKLISVDRVHALVGGSWWINAVVKSAERNKLPLLSCETLYNDDFVPGKTYFTLQGDLRDWVRVFEPLIEQRALGRGAVVHFTSGFGETIAQEMREVFSKPGRELVSAISYNDIQLADAPSIILQLKRAHPDFIYIDAQPGGYATLLRKLREAGIVHTPIAGHSGLADAVRDNLVAYGDFTELYALRRETFDKDFSNRFRAYFGEPPLLNADLGYYAVHLLAQAFKEPDPIKALQSGLVVKGRRFNFDDHNVHTGVRQEMFKVSPSSDSHR